MNNAAKLRRIVLLRAGRIEHGDIEIDGSVQLYGTNNRGKTSVISSIRFLFIPFVDQMGFHYKTAETAAYYFGDEASSMIFECLSSTNRLVTVIVWHDGILGKHGFERYIYTGGYKQDDFFDDEGNSRSHADVLARLSGKGVRKLEPKWVASVMTGITGEAPPDIPLIGLAPVRNINDYDRFIVLFRNLLNLSKLSQQNIKDTFISINRQSLSRTELQVHKESADHFAREASERITIETLGGLAITIRSALEAGDIWRAGRRRLPSMYDALDNARRARKAELETEIQRAEADIHRAGEAIQQLGEQIYTAKMNQGTLNQRMGALNDHLARHTQGATDNQWESYSDSLEAEAIRNLDAEFTRLQGRIGVAQHESLATVQRRVKDQERELERKTRNLAAFGSLLGTRLCEKLPEETVRDAARLLNPSVLHLAVGTEATITDEKALLAAVEHTAVLSRTGDGRSIGVQFDPSHLEAPDLSEYLNIDELRAAINALGLQLQVAREQLAAAEAIDQLQQRAALLKSQLDTARVRHQGYQAWRADLLERVPVWKKEAAQKRKEIEESATALFVLERKMADENKGRAEVHERLLREFRPALERCATLKVRRPDWDNWAGERDDEALGNFGASGRYEDMVSQYESEYDLAIGKRDQFEALILQLRRATAGAYDKPTDEETIAALSEALDSLDERKRVHEKTVRDLVTALRSGASHMIESLNTLENEIKRFNTKFSAASISDLRSVNISMFRNHTEIDSLKAILSISDDMFGDPRKIEDIRQSLSSKAYFKLEDLFGIEFIAEDGAGKKTKVDDLQKSVGSTGTTITIKVMFCVMLLRGLLKPKAETALPFFVDEVNALDTNNLRAVMKIAKEQGFTPILASPQAVGAARNIYHVQDIGGGLSTIPPKSKIGRTELAAPEPEGVNG